MSVESGIGRGAGGPRRKPLLSQAPEKHSLNTTQEAGR
ncbi:hypothetical protein SAMN05428938_5757 [Streptomyces sp. KS_5]|nr:hypothetical protein SAMN05216482_2322 [Streptomyces sp. PAN_FS17]SED72353.1 hypothetical protein SAMN05428938_5757 [Streptomyces sp. KS_5]